MAIINYFGFEKELEMHFKTENHLMTEDLIRYIFVKLHNNNAKIEVPYLRTNGIKTPIKIKQAYSSYFSNNLARADLYYEKNVFEITSDEKDTVIEFKFHRCTEYSQNCTTSKIGSVFANLNRLSILQNDEKYLIYVFDEHMYNYLANGEVTKSPRGYFDVNQINQGTVYSISPNSSKNPGFFGKEFSKNALKGFNRNIVPNMSVFNYAIQLEYAKKIPNVDYYIVVYKVL